MARGASLLAPAPAPAPAPGLGLGVVRGFARRRGGMMAWAPRLAMASWPRRVSWAPSAATDAIGSASGDPRDHPGQPPGQPRRIAPPAMGDLDGARLHRRPAGPQMRLAPDAPARPAVLARVPFALAADLGAAHLDPGAVDRRVPGTLSPLTRRLHLRCPRPAARRAVVRHRPVGAGQSSPASRSRPAGAGSPRTPSSASAAARTAPRSSGAPGWRSSGDRCTGPIIDPPRRRTPAGGPACPTARPSAPSTRRTRPSASPAHASRGVAGPPGGGDAGSAPVGSSRPAVPPNP